MKNTIFIFSCLLFWVAMLFLIAWIFSIQGCSSTDRIGSPRSQDRDKIDTVAPIESVFVAWSITQIGQEQKSMGRITFNGELIAGGSILTLPQSGGGLMAVGEYVKLTYVAITPDIETKGYFYLPDFGNKTMGNVSTSNSGSFSMVEKVTK